MTAQTFQFLPRRGDGLQLVFCRKTAEAHVVDSVGADRDHPGCRQPNELGPRRAIEHRGAAPQRSPIAQRRHRGLGGSPPLEAAADSDEPTGGLHSLSSNRVRFDGFLRSSANRSPWVPEGRERINVPSRSHQNPRAPPSAPVVTNTVMGNPLASAIGTALVRLSTYPSSRVTTTRGRRDGTHSSFRVDGSPYRAISSS